MPYKASLSELNVEQLEAAYSRTNTLVIACPGSGKTKMLATKAAMLLDEGDTRVAAVTFSKESATELLHRIKTMTTKSCLKRLFVGTFHSMAYKQLPTRLDIASEGQRIAYVRSALEEIGMKMPFKDAQMVIDGFKSKHVIPDAETVEGKLYHLYQKQLQLNRQMDFSDMVSLAVDGMAEGRVDAYPLDHLLVDEFQDTDIVQFKWMMAHHAKGAQITAVGDDDQSIFGFRSAMGFNGMVRFTEDTNARQIVLGKNYRCRSEILQAADNLIRNNKDRIPKELVAAKGAGGKLLTKLFNTVDKEASFIAESIGDTGKHSHAVLSRNNKDLTFIETVLRCAEIPYYRPSDKSIFAYPEVAMFISLVELVAGLKKDVGIDAIFRYVDIPDEDRDILHELKIPNFQKVSKAKLMEVGVSSDGATIYRDFATKFEEWQEFHKRAGFSWMINGIYEWLHSKVPPRLTGTLMVLQAACLALDTLKGDIAARIRFLQENKNNVKRDDAVILSTLHGSKGLEWDRVFIIRAETSICPSDKSPLDEERRLFYVGATRARECLTITMTTKNATSPFVHELMLAS